MLCMKSFCEKYRLLFLIVILPALGFSQTDVTLESAYRTPSQVLVDIIDASPTPSVSIGPNREWLLILERPSLPSIEQLAERELRLAGLRINPQTNARSRTRPYSSLLLLRISDLTERKISGLPDMARIENVNWSPDGSHIAFTHTRESGVELWVVDVSSGKARRLSRSPLSLTADEPPKWLPDSHSLICTFVPRGRNSEPKAPEVPLGPVIQENIGKTAPARTYQDLLKNDHDETLFEHYLTAQLAKVTLKGKITHLGSPGIIWNYTPSPDGMYLLVETIHRPFSYLVPVYRFPKRVEIWDLKGDIIHTVADLPLHEEIPITFGSVPSGPRNLEWRADANATLAWTEALDGGDAGVEADVRDQVYLLAAPFQAEPVPLITLALRFSNITWSTDDLALVSERWRKTRRTRTWIVSPGNPLAQPEVLFDRSREDRYSDPGDPVTKKNAMGYQVLYTTDEAQTLFLIGEGASPEGNRPFIDMLDLSTKETKRLFRSEAPVYEWPVLPLDNSGQTLLTRRETVDDPANYFVRDTKENTLRQVTFFPHPTPQLSGIQKELIRYQREDGVQLTATLCLPRDYEIDDGPLPMVMWAYPREFKSVNAAGQITTSPYRFDRLSYRSQLVWLAMGYAVLNNLTMPIIGEGEEEPNDTYVEQLVSSAAAAVDEVVR
ncbi:MAG: S9 family peptidase, partial [Candidatus Neomarinimicrobiota bacterium]